MCISSESVRIALLGLFVIELSYTFIVVYYSYLLLRIHFNPYVLTATGFHCISLTSLTYTGSILDDKIDIHVIFAYCNSNEMLVWMPRCYVSIALSTQSHLHHLSILHSRFSHT